MYIYGVYIYIYIVVCIYIYIQGVKSLRTAPGLHAGTVKEKAYVCV